MAINDGVPVLSTCAYNRQMTLEAAFTFASKSSKDKIGGNRAVNQLSDLEQTQGKALLPESLCIRDKGLRDQDDTHLPCPDAEWCRTS